MSALQKFINEQEIKQLHEISHQKSSTIDNNLTHKIDQPFETTKKIQGLRLFQNASLQNHRPSLQTTKQLFQPNDGKVITVPIKQYSNKFLRQKKKQQQMENNSKKKEPFLNTHLQNNRKLISDFKKSKGKSQKFRKSVNKENADFIMHNLLFEKNQLFYTNNHSHQKTIFGAFTQNYPQHSTTTNTEESVLFDKGWKTIKNENPFLTRKQIYELICQKQKSLIPQYRKKCKTFADVSNLDYQQEKQKKLQKISTSRALQKYSKIIKINPEHGKIQKMKIKKELAKSLRFQNSEKSQFEAKQITLAKKQQIKNKNFLISQEKPLSKRHYSIDHTNKQNQQISHSIKTPEKLKNPKSRLQAALQSKIGMLTSGIKFKKFRKFSHQVDSNKRCVTQERGFMNDANETFGDFEINGWDINF